MHPATRGRYLEAVRPRPLIRLYYEAADGWRAPVFHLPPAPGGAGEPVLLAHGLGVGCDAFRYGTGDTLAGHLASLGFSVYLLAHRGDAAAIPPSRRALAEASFDDILSRDLPAAAEQVLAHSDYPRVHFVGHGLGGLLGMTWAAQRPEALAGVVALGAPIQFKPLASDLRRTARAVSLLPAHWQVPARALARLSAPFIDDAASSMPGARVRGVMEFATEDLPIGLLRQLLAWQDRGVPTTAEGLFDYAESLVDADVPLLVVAGADDAVVSSADALPALDRWGHPDRHAVTLPGYDYLDLLLGDRAAADVFAPVGAWLAERRRQLWRQDGELRAS